MKKLYSFYACLLLVLIVAFVTISITFYHDNGHQIWEDKNVQTRFGDIQRILGVNQEKKPLANTKLAPNTITPENFGKYFTPVNSLDQLIQLSEQQKKPFFPLEFEDAKSVELRKVSKQMPYLAMTARDRQNGTAYNKEYQEEVLGYLVTSRNPIYFLSLENGHVISIDDYVNAESGGKHVAPSVIFPDELDLQLSAPEDVDFNSTHPLDNSDPKSQLLSVIITTYKKADVGFLKNLGDTVSKGDRVLVFEGSQAFHLLNLTFWPNGVDYPANSLLLQVNIHTPPAGSPYPYGYYEENFYSELNSFAMLNGKVAYLTR